MSRINQDSIAIILGGGKGNRLFPLTKLRSKPAVPLAGRYRLIDIPISNCIHSGLDRMFVLTQFNSASLNQHIARTYNFDSFSGGFVEVLAAEQTEGSEEWFQGTADAVRKVYTHVKDLNWEHVIILSGDHLYRMDYSKFLEKHIERKADISLCVLPVDQKSAEGFGLLKVDENHRIVEFIEKPKGKDQDPYRLDTTAFGLSPEDAAKKPFLASMGIYIFNRKILEKSLFDDLTMNDFGKQILPKTLGSYDVYAHMFEGYWEDIGTIRSFFEANLSLCQRHPPFHLFHPTRPFFTRPRHLPGSTVIESHISNCLINDGTLIEKAEIRNSIIGIRTYIQKDVLIDGCLILGADYFKDDKCQASIPLGIGEGSIIKNAIIDKNARIGKNVIIENQKKLKHFDGPEGQYYIREGIVIIPKNVVIPDGTVI